MGHKEYYMEATTSDGRVWIRYLWSEMIKGGNRLNYTQLMIITTTTDSAFKCSWLQNIASSSQTERPADDDVDRFTTGLKESLE